VAPRGRRSPLILTCGRVGVQDCGRDRVGEVSGGPGASIHGETRDGGATGWCDDLHRDMMLPWSWLRARSKCVLADPDR
jgi:hypothetical protein